MKISIDDKLELAKYLIDFWGDEENFPEIDYEIALDKAIEAEGRGNPIRWKNTPSQTACDIFRNLYEN